jgi:hypothetical protein
MDRNASLALLLDIGFPGCLTSNKSHQHAYPAVGVPYIAAMWAFGLRETPKLTNSQVHVLMIANQSARNLWHARNISALAADPHRVFERMTP